MMPFQNAFAILAYSAATAAGLYLMRRHKRANPVFWFLIFQWVMAVGTLYLADLRSESDRLYLYLFFLTLVCYLAGTLSYWISHNVSAKAAVFWQQPLRDDGFSQRLSVAIVLVFSGVVTTAYYNAVGGNILLSILRGGEVEDYSSARLATYSGDNYFAPGYVNQFKNVLLPVTVSIIGGWVWLRRWRLTLLGVAVVGGGLVSVALLGTGQRAFLVYSYAAVLFGLSAARTLKWRHLLLPSLVVFAIFAFVTSFYQARNLEDASNRYLAIVLKAIDRFFVIEQQGALGAFRHIYTQETVYFTEWRDQLVGIIPGKPGSTLQHDLFYLVHGTDRGTESYAVLTGFYYNGGIAAVVVCYGLIGIVHAALYRRFVSGSRTVFRVFSYGALFFYLSSFVSGGPSSLIDNGVVTLLLLICIRKLEYFSPPPALSRSPAPVVNL